MSDNVAYGQVRVESAPLDTYEELDSLAVGDHGAPVYAIADDTTTTPTGRQGTL